MWKYILKRFLACFLTLLVICTLVFFLVQLVPGNPFLQTREMSQQVIDNLMAKYNLDKPLIVRYLYFMGDLFRFDFGISIKHVGRTVNDIIRDGFPISMRIAFFSTAIGAVLGVTLGTLAALKRGTFIDNLCMGIAIMGLSATIIVIAPLLQIVFAVKLKWLPVALLETPRHYILPIAGIAFVTMATDARIARSSVLNVLSQDYILTARAKGLSEFHVITRHVVRNAMIPIVTIVGMNLAYNSVGSFFLETVYAIPGMGRYLVEAVGSLDYGVIMGLTVFFAMILLIFTFLIDLTYGIIDPRVRLS